MIIEVAMLAILIYRPSIWLAIWLGVLVAFRRVPWFANEIARMLNLDEQVGMTAWAGRGLLPAWDGARVMSRLGAQVGEQIDQRSTDLQTETNNEIDETPQRVAETPGESFTFGETEALARLVASGKIGLTDAVKIGAGAKSGEKYQKRSREIKQAVEEMKNRYPQRTPDQQQQRDELGLPKQ